MYQFVDLMERGAKGASTSIETIFNGENLDQVLTDEAGSFRTLTTKGRADITKRIPTQEVGGMDGLLEDEGSTMSERSIIVRYKIEDATNEGFRNRYNRLNHLLEGTKKKLVFTDEQVYFYATLSDHEVPEEDSNTLIGTLTFLCSDPIKYGEEDFAYLSGENATAVFVEGSANTKPIFELEVLNKITYAMVAKNDEEYMMVGKPYDVDNKPFEKYETVLFDDASNLTGWASANPGEINGTVAGEMKTNGYRFQTVDYGVGSSWHGPAIKQGLSSPISDFRVEAKVTFRNTEPEDIGRVEVYGLDVHGNQLFKLAMKDILGGKVQSFGEARVGGGVTNHFLIAESGDKGWEWNNFEGALRIEREGQQWKAYIAQIVDGIHKARRPSPIWTDHQGTFTADLAQVVVHTAQNATYQTPNQGLDSIRVEEINQQPSGIPYIAGPGDRLEFNHKTKEIFLNGELRKDLKHLGAHPFLLPPGESFISLLPTGDLEGKIRWSPAYQ
ncbi:distal tail protein Dit [Halobacillus sp. BAB-2008]|uniref:distal tail protein Dit n=1 Tax=Halobacillus sp. BAB-2008 TaxID=1246484 RepID=UPI0002A4F01A|nr:distal tail protein Dit [Halobacillus sp. BAB-2008]ELK47177.1 phage tail component [Halobacillus sp. BAB-2008]